MSYTVVYDQAENQKQIMNAINAFARRCRIGKVRPRFTGWSDLGTSKVNVTYPPLPGFPPAINETGTGYMPKCECKIGSACGNAACPHMPIAC